jgi:hypothetical protein
MGQKIFNRLKIGDQPLDETSLVLKKARTSQNTAAAEVFLLY